MLLFLFLLIPFDIKVEDNNYFEYLQKGRNDYFQKINYFKNKDFKFFVTNININFWKEIRKNDKLTITTSVIFFDKKSFKLRQLIHCKEMLISDAIVTLVIMEEGKIKELPQELIRALE